MAAAPRAHPCPREEKSGERIEEVISRSFVSDKGCAGNPGRHALSPQARRDRQGPPRPIRPGRLRSARLPRPRRVRPVEKSRTGCAGAAGGRASAQAQGGCVFLANQVSEWPFGSPLVHKGHTTRNRRPDRRVRRQVNASLLTSAHYCPELPGIARQKNIAPEQMSAHRQPFSVGLTTSAVSGSSGRPPGSFRCGSRKMNPC